MGGTSLTSIQQFPGGRKSVQLLGNFLDTISLQGTFMYQGAVSKMNKINDMWMKKQPVLLTAPGFSPRYVLITMFHPTYYNDYQIDYDISLEPIDSANSDAVIYSSSSAASSSSSSPSSVSSAQSDKVQQKYTVKSGDTLWGIAQKFYGDGSQYTKIVTANNIKNPSVIQVGTVLIIP